MNTTLWILQILLAAAFGMAGFGKVFQYETAKKKMAWVSAVPKATVHFIGASELAGAVGLVLPAATHVLAVLSAVAAAALTVVMALAVGFHIRRKDGQFAPALVLGLLTAFTAYGRFVLAPLQ